MAAVREKYPVLTVQRLHRGLPAALARAERRNLHATPNETMLEWRVDGGDNTHVVIICDMEGLRIAPGDDLPEHAIPCCVRCPYYESGGVCAHVGAVYLTMAAMTGVGQKSLERVS